MSKIVLITMEYPPFFGGVGNYYYNLIKNLGNDVTIFVDKKSLTDVNEKVANINYVELFYKYLPFKWLKIVFLIKKINDSKEKSIFWAGNILPIGSACWLAKLFFKTKYFVSLHGLDWQMATINPRKKWLAYNILDKAEFITVNSQSTYNLLPEKFKNKTEIVYPSVSIDHNIDHNNLSEFNLESQKYFLIVGRLVKRKGQKQAILAWQKILTNFPEYKLVIVGNGPLLKELKSLISNIKLLGKVVILNNLKNEEVALLYKNAYCFLFPVQPLDNDIEGFGIVGLEAQHYNLPVIATAVGGVTEALGDGAYYIKSGTVDEICLAVTELITNSSKYQELINKSKMNVKTFSWQKSADIINKAINLYD